MEYFKSTSEIRAEVIGNYVYVRNLGQRGGVIDAILTERTSKKVAEILQKITTEPFSTVWDSLNKIKGVRFEYLSN